MKRFLVPILLLVMVCTAVPGALSEQPGGVGSPLPVKVLIMPKFEVEGMAGDFPREAQYYYEAYLTDAEEYDVPYGAPGVKLYYKDGVALYVLGMGAVFKIFCKRANCDAQMIPGA